MKETRVEQGWLRHEVKIAEDDRLAQVWYHGTVAEFELLGARAPQSATRGFNPRLGLHFASERRSAEGFAIGLYRNQSGQHQRGKVYAVRLTSRAAKVFPSEQALNGDFLDFCLERGDLVAKDIEETRAWRRLPKGPAGGSAYWAKLSVWASTDLAAGIKNLDLVVDAYRQHLIEAGYDAVVYLNDVEGFATPCAIVFNRDQIELLEVWRQGSEIDLLAKLDGGQIEEPPLVGS
jgi:hypothetical protein